MQYQATVRREGKRVLADFPDCPGCQTFAEPGQRIEDVAQEALEGWLESSLIDGEVPPKPKHRLRPQRGAWLLSVDVSAELWVKLSLRWARTEAGWSQAELARRAGISQQMVAKLENPKYHQRFEALDTVLRALGRRLRVELEKAKAA
jgi:DNA-binding XRE family transcriptional regulator/predicted RNase H-like HicB family nuclease